MGRTFLAFGRVSDAIVAWDSVAARPDDADLLISLGTALAAVGRTADAVRTLERATVVEPLSTRGLDPAGVLALVRHDLGNASDALFHSLDLDPDGGEARYHLALLRVMVGAPAEARRLLEDLVAEHSGWAKEAASLLDCL